MISRHFWHSLQHYFLYFAKMLRMSQTQCSIWSAYVFPHFIDPPACHEMIGPRLYKSSRFKKPTVGKKKRVIELHGWEKWKWASFFFFFFPQRKKISYCLWIFFKKTIKVEVLVNSSFFMRKTPAQVMWLLRCVDGVARPCKSNMNYELHEWVNSCAVPWWWAISLE